MHSDLHHHFHVLLGFLVAIPHKGEDAREGRRLGGFCGGGGGGGGTQKQNKKNKK